LFYVIAITTKYLDNEVRCPFG